MDASSLPPPHPPTPPPGGFATPVRGYAPQVVHVIAKPGGFSRAVGFVTGLIVFGFVFFFGLVIGVIIMVGSGTLDDMILRKTYRDGGRDSIAIIPVMGTIDARASQFVRACVDHVLDDRTIKGVILRVDSPGGGVTASDQIWYEVNRLRDSGLPVIASYGGVAASGGYYVSCATDHIIAEETCTTGSIGVISQAFVVDELMTKVGVDAKTLVASGSPDKDLGNPFREWTDQDRQTIITMLDAAYDTFTTRVRDGRADAITDPARVEELADGSIYTAQEALDNGLIDEIGYLDDAVAVAEKHASLRSGSSSVFWLTEPPTLFGNGLLARTGRSSRTAAHPLEADRIRDVLSELTTPRVMYLMQ